MIDWRIEFDAGKERGGWGMYVYMFLESRIVHSGECDAGGYNRVYLWFGGFVAMTMEED